MGYDIDRYISVINTELMAGKGPINPDHIPACYKVLQEKYLC
jgi:hypothetical protein